MDDMTSVRSLTCERFTAFLQSLLLLLQGEIICKNVLGSRWPVIAYILLQWPGLANGVARLIAAHPAPGPSPGGGMYVCRPRRFT